MKLRTVCFLLVGVIGAYFFYGWADKQFRYENIALEEAFFPGSPEFPPSAEALALLHQPFSYLDSGKQSFAFVSDDGHYVLKFFDRSRLRQWNDSARARARMAQAVQGYVTADHYDRDHVGLLYFHRIARNDALPTIQVKDRFGWTHQIDLNAVPFVLQKKATPTRLVIAAYLDRGEHEAAQRAFEALMAMYADEHARGVYDADRNLMHNTGFVGNLPIRIDAGRLTIDERLKDPAKSQEEIGLLQRKRIAPWLKRHGFSDDATVPNGPSSKD